MTYFSKSPARVFARLVFSFFFSMIEMNNNLVISMNYRPSNEAVYKESVSH